MVWSERRAASRETHVKYKYLRENTSFLEKYEEESEVTYDYGKMVILMFLELMCVNTVNARCAASESENYNLC